MSTTPTQPATFRQALRMLRKDIVPWSVRTVMIVLCLIAALTIVIAPNPAFIMDLCLSFNILLGFLMLLVSIFAPSPLVISVFSLVLFILTLLRLSLSIVCLWLILGRRANNIEATGKLIATIGSYAAGVAGTDSPLSFALGGVAFIILVLIQFVVIVRISYRIGTAAALFPLDIAPGRQMAIDVVLNAGIINESEAERRRNEVRQLGDFCDITNTITGFICNDSICAIVVTGVSMLLGFIISVFRNGIGFVDAARVFTVLMIGNGLLFFVPFLLVCISVGCFFTRFANFCVFDVKAIIQAIGWHIKQGSIFAVVGVLLGFFGLSGMFGLVPFPPLPPLAASGCAFFLWWRITYPRGHDPIKARAQTSAEESLAKQDKNTPKPDVIELQIGDGLALQIEPQWPGGGIFASVRKIRRQLAEELGISTPPVRIRDYTHLEANQYHIMNHGVFVAEGFVELDKLLAIDFGSATERLHGKEVTKPPFGVRAVWIPDTNRVYALRAGYVVVGIETVIAMHLAELIRSGTVNFTDLSK